MSVSKQRIYCVEKKKNAKWDYDARVIDIILLVNDFTWYMLISADDKNFWYKKYGGMFGVNPCGKMLW